MSGTGVGRTLLFVGVILLSSATKAEEAKSPGAAAVDAALADTLPPAKLPRLGQDALPQLPAAATRLRSGTGGHSEDNGKEANGKPDKNKGPAWSRPPQDLPKGLLKKLSKLLKKMRNKAHGPGHTPGSPPGQANGKVRGYSRSKGKP